MIKKIIEKYTKASVACMIARLRQEIAEGAV